MLTIKNWNKKRKWGYKKYHQFQCRCGKKNENILGKKEIEWFARWCQQCVDPFDLLANIAINGAYEFWLLLWNCKVGSISNSQHHTQTPPLKSHYPPTWWFALKRIQFLVLSQQKQSWTMFLNFHWNHFLLECNEWEDQVQNFQRTQTKKNHESSSFRN